MDIRLHRQVQADLDKILRKYYEVSNQLGEDFFAEFQVALRRAAENPQRYHFDRSGLRRCNLERFPYHLLYDIHAENVRIWVLRHNRRHPAFGLERFSE